jgi:signal transduction histidine kinase
MDAATRIQAISDIREQAERLNGMVENMLLMARASAQTAVPTEAVLIKGAIGEVILDHQKRYPARRLALSVSPVGLMVDGQPDYLKQVIQNLLSNSEKYSPMERRIDIRARRAKNEVITSVLDRGSGLVPGEAEIIFQPFFRSGATSMKVSGAGIGLAVCKLLVQAQSGRIWAAPRRGGGSAFSFSLPIAASLTL